MLQYLPSCILVVIYIILVFLSFSVSIYLFLTVFLFMKNMVFHYLHSVQWGITPPKNHPPLVCQAPLKSGNCPSPPLRQSLYILVFCYPLPLFENWIFQGTLKILKFSSSTLYQLLKFLNLNFYYLYMTRYKTFLFIIFFCSYISDFILFFM